MTEIDPRAMMRAARMSPVQLAAVAVTFLLAAIDGFDVLAVTLAAPGISRDWGVDHGVLGIIFSSGYVGMAAGALLLAPVADVVGRRPVIFVCLALMSAGMLAAGLSQSIALLIAARLFAGVGIGAMLSLINPLATEFASERRRDLAVSVMAIGYPVGGIVGASIAGLVLEHLDWHWIFLIGAGLSVMTVPLVMVWLPEPLSFLIERPRSDALDRVNALMRRCGLPYVTSLPAPVGRTTRLPASALFGPTQFAATIRVVLIVLLFIVPVQYVHNWLPQLVADRGFSPAQASTVSLTLSMAGVIGGIAIGWLAGIFGLQRMALCTFILFAIACTVIGYAPADIDVLRGMAILLGLALYGGMCALHAFVSRSFPDHLRASGAGLSFGMGRVGSALSQAVVGALFAVGISREAMSLSMSAGAVAAALVLAAHGLRTARATPAQAQVI